MSATDRLRAAERLEAEAYTDRALAAAALPQNPLGVGVERLGAASAPVYTRLDHPLLNRVVGLGVAEPAIEVDVASIIDAYRLRGLRRFGVVLSAIAEPPELPAWLVRAGFAPHGGTAKWLRPPGRVPAVEGAVDVVEAGQAEADDFAAVICAAHGLPETAAPLATCTIDRFGWRHYLARLDGVPCAAAALFVHGGLAWLGLAGTLVAARRSGAQAALLARRLADAEQLGCELAVAETPSSDESPSFRNVRRSGFELVGVRPTYVYEGG